MKPTLTFEMQKLYVGSLGEEAGVPDLIGISMLQNDLKFDLGEDDEIYEGYGRRKTAYPYRQQNTYHGEEVLTDMKTAVLENDYLKAVFLPEQGGRLWSLFDKKKQRNLLYTNDVIRYRNLAVRNAWFSGGVEWNIGVIGHTPFTTEQLFTARLSNEQGNPILRMYEYERIRGVVYQMDFWLEEDSRFLNCRMRIENFGTEVVPMYWWSNMAVPEHKNGRIIVPASKAYTFRDGTVCKVEIPVVDGIDITHYEQIPKMVDYFFSLKDDAPRYIANVDENGYGLLHLSTDRLQSRKLFSWGNQDAADRWQEFLTKCGGRYIEIQAGLGKTQYGCLPMAPHTAWEWMEQYGPLQLTEQELKEPYEQLMEDTSEHVLRETEVTLLPGLLKATKTLAHKKGELIYSGSGYGALRNKETALPKHLDFGECQQAQLPWAAFLDTGVLQEPSVREKPEAFMVEESFYKKLNDTIEGVNRDNWYAHYQLGVLHFQREKNHHAQKEWELSLQKKENPWAYHALAALKLTEGRKGEAAAFMQKGIGLYAADLSYLKEGFTILLQCEAYDNILRLYDTLSGDMQMESRLQFIRLQALAAVGRFREAYELLSCEEGFLLEDLREGEDSIDALWKYLRKELYGDGKEVPHRYHFTY